MLSLERKSMLPPFSRLAMVGLAVDAPFIAFALIEANVKIGLSLFAGWGLVVAVYGMLHLIVGRGLGFFTPDKPAAGGRANNTASIAGFAAAMVGKYFLIGALLFFIWRTGYLSPMPFVAGFLLAEVAIIWYTVRAMKRPVG